MTKVPHGSKAPDSWPSATIGFSRAQLKKLVGPLDPARVKRREREGQVFEYIEGWYALAQANAIFGYAGWDREMAAFERVFETRDGSETACGYLARVKVTVRAGQNLVVREGTGFGEARALLRAQAHERALKAAETDATKRALATFGTRFGLGLYDKDGASAVESGKSRRDPGVSRAANSFVLNDETGAVLVDRLSAQSFCSGLRQLIEAARPEPLVGRVLVANRPMLARLRREYPELCSVRGRHFADILEQLAARRIPEPGGKPNGADLASGSGGHMRALRQNGGSGDRSPSTALAIDGVPALIRGIAPSNRGGPGMASSTPDEGGLPRGSDRREEGAPSDFTPAPSSLSEGRVPTEVSSSTNGVGNARVAGLDPCASQSTGADSEVAPLTLSSPVLPDGVGQAGTSDGKPETQPQGDYQPTSRIGTGPAVDKSKLAIATIKRVRHKAHRVFVASQPCLICSGSPCDAHHLTFAQPRGLSLKVSDEFTVPLCTIHHNALHSHANERSFWRFHRIEPLSVAHQLWDATKAQQGQVERQTSRPNEDRN